MLELLFAAGLPVIASPVRTNRDFVEKSGAGLFASTRSEWIGATQKGLMKQKSGGKGENAAAQSSSDHEYCFASIDKMLNKIVVSGLVIFFGLKIYCSFIRCCF